MEVERYASKPGQGGLLRLPVVRALLLACGWVMAAAPWLARAEVTQDFSGWAQGAPVTQGAGPWISATNNDWILGTGQIWTDYAFWHPHSATQACWLRDYDESTNSWLRSPWLSNGVGRVTWYALNRFNSSSCQFQLQYSTNGTGWETVAAYTNATAGYAWAGYTNILEEWRAGYLRWRHGPDSRSDLRLGLDDLVLADPKGFKLTNLAHTPASPTIDDAVNIQCNVRINVNAGSTAVNAYYRFGTNGSFAWRPMAVVSGTLWRTQTPVPAGRTGIVQYYVEATYTGMGGGSVRLPEKGVQTWTSTDPGGGTIDPRQNGPCSRATGLSISEVMYHPAPRADGLDLEYVEVLNSEPVPADLGGYRLSGDVEYTFATGTVVAAGARVVVAADPHAVELVFPTSGILGPWTGSLPNAGGTVRLRNAVGAVLVEVEYDDQVPWPAAADGGGASLVQMKPDYGEGDVRSWAPSARVGGSPGYTLPNWGEALSKVAINEWVTHTDPPLEDSVELYNGGNSVVSLAGCVLTDDISTNRFVIPLGTTIAADGYVVFTATQLGFDLSMSGDRLFLLGPSGTRVVDAISFGAQENAVSWGRTPDGAAEWTELAARTFGSANARARLREVAINEIMYHPISGVNADEYVELVNRSAGAVDIGNWRFIDGIDYRFPAGTTIAAGGYVVVASDRTRLLSRYPALAPAKVFGNYTGQLSDRGERLVLAKPDDPALPGQDFVPVDEVTYSDGWGQWADGGGSSLELIDTHSDNRLGPNWAGSDETAKSAWTTIQTTGVLDNGVWSPDSLQVTLQGPGECLVDNVSVTPSGGANLISNPTFESGITGWVAEGNQGDSRLETTEGDASTKCLRMITQDGGDTGANRVRTTLTSTPSTGLTVTIRARVRWLAGSPEILFRLRGNWLDVMGYTPTAFALGTPGAANSRAKTNTGPAVWNVSHAPLLPAASAAVTVTARLDDPDGLGSVSLVYRIDSPTASGPFTLAMNDAGTGADAVAGDGLYSASIPGQAAAVMAAFYVSAPDGAASPVTGRFPDNAPTRECLVRWGDPVQAGAFGVYRIWLTQATLNTWISRPDQSNKNLDCTFIYGDGRVIYNSGARYSGSPFRDWSSPLADCDYLLTFPAGNLLLGETECTIQTPGNGGGDSTCQTEQTAYWIGQQIGLPTCRRRSINMFANGVRKGQLLEDAEQPSGSYVDQRWPDSPRGDLHKIMLWFEFDDNLGFGASSATLDPVTTTGGKKKTERYRQTFGKRAVKGSSNNFTNLFALVDAVNVAGTGETYRRRIEAVVDVDNWLRTYAVEHCVGNGDSFGYGLGQNMYTYRPAGDLWRHTMWDVDFAFNNAGATSGMFDGISRSNGGVDLAEPGLLRRYWRAMYDLAYGPLVSSRINPLVEARYAAMVADGRSVSSPDGIKNYASQRRAYLISQLATVAAPLAITSNGGANFSTASNPVTLTGTAPVEIETLKLNGVACPVTWTSVNAWQAKVMLVPGANVLTFSGWLRGGGAATNAPDSITVTYTGSTVLPEGWVTINEIQYHPTDPYGSYVELYNRHATATFDLGGMRLAGADVTFAPGTLLAPGQYGVVAESVPGYAAAYTNAEAVIATYGGSLDNGGEWLRLWRPGAGTNEALVDEVYYDNSAPWPTAADGTGPSLQLIDATRDNNRVGNWAVDAVKRFTPGKVNSVAASLPVFPSVWINEAMPSNTSFVADNAGDYDPWLELYNGEAAPVTLNGSYRLSVNATNLSGWAFSPSRTVAAGGYQMVWMDAEASETTPSELHAGLRLSSPTGLVVLVWNSAGRDLVLDYLRWNGTVPANSSWGRYPEGERYGEHLFHYPTPGTANDPSSEVVTVALNEWMASNTRTISDPANPVQPAWDDWFELHNYGGSSVNLTGFTLTDNLGNPTKYRIPLGRTLSAGAYLRVWADEETGQNAVSNGDLHVNFKLSAGGEALGLYAPDGTPLDMQGFETQLPDISEGRWPDGTGTVWQMAIPTPKASNVLFEVQQVRTNAGGTVRLQWNARPGWLYRLWSNTDLLSGAWQPVGTGYWASATTMSTNVPATGPRYYRVGQR